MQKLLTCLVATASVGALGLGCAKQTEVKPAITPPPKAPISMPSNDPAPSDADAKRVATANNAFAVAWWKIQAARGNLAMSPASITTALAMTWGGAKGKTSDEMRAALHFEGDVAAVQAAYSSLAATLQDPARPLKLRMANRLFGEQTFKFEQPFIDQTAKAFGAPLQPMDFVGKPDEQRTAMNQWVEQQTEQRIKDLLPPRSITSTTRMVLVNAIYFLADWAEPFKEMFTSDAPFALTASKFKNVATMHNRVNARLYTSNAASVLELPYQGDDAAMWIVLPTKLDGLAAVEAGLTPDSLATWQAGFKKQQVDVALPKFEINPTAPLALSEALTKLGIVDAFSDSKADFTGIGVPPNPTHRLYISEVFHKAFVKVNEKGTEAAAATAVVMAEGGGMPQPAPKFVADHPFLFMIVDQRTGMILFMGRVSDPQ
ncbi:MAG TPA: serpin family protein [Kofleriaceae bacterium]|nr:serpin family protein [Kofleriaceae bacterium]